MIHPTLTAFATTLCSLSIFTSIAEAGCSSFSPVDNRYNSAQVYTATLEEFRVSAIVNCTGVNLGSQSPRTGVRCNATECDLSMPSDYYLQINSTLNVTDSDDQKRSILDLVKLNTTGLNSPTWPTDLNVTMVHSVTSSQTCLREGLAGYWNFAPTFNCVQGTLHGCEDDTADLEDTVITACGLRLLNVDSYDGTLLVSQTDNVPVEGVPVRANATMTGTNPLPTGGVEKAVAMSTEKLILIIASLVLASYH